VNLNELNRVLSDEIYKLRAGKTKPERINAITRAGAVMIAGVRTALMCSKITGIPLSTVPFFADNLRKALPHKNGSKVPANPEKRK
jgi:predicted RecB family endonuclease